MNKNNKKTMNERTHNSFDVYKDNRNSNSNTNDKGENRNVELAEDFDNRNRDSRANNEQCRPLDFNE
ncbi:hypothetical protein AB1K83_11590 [Sporosarcina sp. 179-K 3D1 HS]|uniref:hypothetical protein n=1 Tax=Sporosarcina sp. 179-K 3D1 HS TaxID=3232169 RepID=UPI0039A120AD